MYHPTLNQTLRCAGLLLPMVLLTACGGHKKVAKAETPAETPVVEVKTPELDGRGSYRFLMSNGDKKMTADEFDAWMKANGIRVAKGNGQGVDLGRHALTGGVRALSTGKGSDPGHDQPLITPSSTPMRVNASMARSRCARVCAALIWVRMRAWPLGTTGKKKPIA